MRARPHADREQTRATRTAETPARREDETLKAAAPARVGAAVDGSPAGRDAAALASMLARGTGAEVMLVGVFEEPLLEAVVPTEFGWRAGQKHLRAILAQTRDGLIPDARIVVEPDALAWRGLRRVAREHHRDLLVVGSAHSAPEGRVSLGRVSRELPGRLECALAISPPGMASRDRARIRRVGVGFDGGPEAVAALELAAGISKRTGAELRVQGAVDDGVAGGLTTEQIALGGEAIVSGQARSLFEKALAATQALGVRACVEVSPSIPADILAALGSELDLLVIGSSRSGHPGRVSLGTTGKALAQGSAPCPIVITARPGR